MTEPPENNDDGNAGDLGAWAARLKDDWERRSQSPSRDFFVASHPGWNDTERWQEQARITIDSILLGYPREKLPAQDVLEIGCGVGRLGLVLDGEARSYTGVDISPGMIEEARRRSEGKGSLRYFESDGVDVPEGARDRPYHLILAVAVFIHCPRDMTAALVRDAWSLLAPGGQIRLQVRGDHLDATGVQSLEAAEAVHEQSRENETLVSEEDAALIEDTPYMGHAFGYDELGVLLRDCAPGAAIELLRADLLSIYASIEKPA